MELIPKLLAETGCQKCALSARRSKDKLDLPEQCLHFFEMDTHKNWKAVLFLAGMSCIFLFFSGCSIYGPVSKKEFDSVAYRPKNPNHVKVKVSLKNRMVYVIEGKRTLLVTPTAIGRAGTPTPMGHFKIYLKDATRRNRTYGFWVKGDSVRPGKSTHSPGAGWRFKGYPMAYWCEFDTGYGFHEGSVWPTPRSRGCLRLHKNVAPKFFALTKIGTPVHIAMTQPEDLTIGKMLEKQRPQDYDDPDLPYDILLSDQVFKKPAKPLFAD